MAAPEGDVIEADEICVRYSPALWLWVAVSRRVGQVLGFALGERTDEMLALCWSDVPMSYRDRPVRTDHWGGYARFFSAAQHRACDKGSGETSRAQAWSTKWRQRQSGLVGKSCGVCARVLGDILERFMILVEQHNQERARCWGTRQKQSRAATRKSP